ncbi:MAG: ATP-binding cassette domain-containing protein [Candidatus Latescibacterota bacterium]
MNNDTILEIQDLDFWYGEQHILDGVSFSVRTGEIMVIIGGSGSGKTTVLKNIIGLNKPNSGSIRLLGNEMTLIEEEDLETVLQDVGVMYQNGALLNSMNIGENVALPLEMHTNMSPELRKAVAELKLFQVELAGAYNKYPRELSGGMKKRAAVARAIVMDPKIIFCDEPSAGLDPITTRELDKLLINLKENLNMTIVVVSHEIESVKRIADRITYIEKGKVLYTGALKDALDQKIPAIQNFFLETNNTID